MVRVFKVSDFVNQLRDEGKIEDHFKVIAQKAINYTQRPIYVVKRTPKGFVSQVYVYGFGFDSEKGIYTPLEPRLVFRRSVKISLQYYPNNPEHADIFSRSEVRRRGPSDEFPGAAAVLNGSLNYSLFLSPDNGHLSYLQYCFKQGSPEDLTKGLVRFYLGAREHLLSVFLNQASRFRIRVLTQSQTFSYSGNVVCLERLLASEKYRHLTVENFG